MHLLEADESAMDNTFETSANLTLYDVSGCQQKQVFQQQFESSFTCCDWNDEDYIAVGNENGEICLTTLNAMLQNQKLNLTKISDQSITFLSFSNEAESLLAVGASDGEFILLKPSGQIIYRFQCKKLQGGETSITSLSWNIKVPRIIASSCQQIVQIHDTQKHTAIQTFVTNKQILDIMFSQTGATNIYVLNDQELQLWDLKDRKQAKIIVQHQLQDATYIKYIEGVEDVLGIFSESGRTIYIQCSTMKIIGQDQLGQIFSYAYPNMYASYIEDKLTLSLYCPIVFNQPVLFNSKLMYNLDLGDEDDLFDSQKLLNTIAISDTNVLYNLQQNQIIKYQINDSDKLVQMAQQLIDQQIKIEDKQVNKLLDYLKLDNQQLIDNIISQSQPLNQVQLNISENKQQQKAEQQEQQEKKQKSQLNDEDFFNNLDMEEDMKQDDDQEEFEEIEEEVEEFVFEGQQYTDINDYLLNGQFEDALNIVINQQKFDLLLELLDTLPLSEETINKYTDIYKQQTKQYQQVLSIAQQIADNQLQDLPCSWMQKLSLAQKQNKDLILLAKQLLNTQLDQDAKIPLLILVNQQQDAINLVLNNKGEDLLQKLEIEIQLNKLHYSFYKSETLSFIKMLKAGGNQDLSEQLANLTNIQVTQQQIQSPQKQQQKRKIHQQVQQPNQLQSPQFQPINNFQLPPTQQQIPNQQMQNIQDPFMISSQSQQLPQQQPFSPNIPQQNGLLNFNQMQNDAVNVVDLSGSNGSQGLNQSNNNNNFFIPQQQPQVQQPQQLPPQMNQMSQLPQQIQQQPQPRPHTTHNRQQYHQQPQQQNQIPQNQPQFFTPTEPMNQPQQPLNQFDQNPFQSPLGQQNFNNMLQPTQIQNQIPQPPMMQPQQQSSYPLPPQQQLLQPQQSQQQQYPQQFTTTPRKMQIFAKPIQQLNPQLKSINLVNSVVLKTTIAQQVKEIAEKLYQKSQLEFQKNSKKIAELLIYLSDYKEVDNLMTDAAIEVIEQYVNQYNMGNIQQAKQLISDFSLQSGDLAQFAGILKIMAK